MKTKLLASALLAFVAGIAAAYIGRGGPSSQAAGQDKADRAAVALKADDNTRPDDRAAIRAVAKSFIAAFERGDAAAAAGHLTAGAEMVTADGETVRGRAAIQKAYADHFTKNPKHTVAVDPESLRFTSRDTAIEEGHLKVSAGKAEPAIHRYTLLHVREDGKWHIAYVRNDESEQASLRDLEWLIGTWSAKGGDAEVQTTYEWMGQRAFIRGNFTVREKGTTLSGMQIIGIDPATGELRTWMFEDNGGFGAGSCTRDGTKWLFESVGVQADGRIASAANVLVPIDSDSFTWQPVSLTIDDEPIRGLPPVKVNRVKGR